MIAATVLMATVQVDMLYTALEKATLQIRVHKIPPQCAGSVRLL